MRRRQRAALIVHNEMHRVPVAQGIQGPPPTSSTVAGAVR